MTNNNLIAQESLSRYEKILGSMEGNSSLFSEAAAQTRMELKAVSPEELEIISVGSGVAGPVLASYVLWTISRALEMRLKRLYFISRDGEVLLEIARRLLPAFWPHEQMELRYLLGSRQAWLLPSFLVSKQNISHYVLDFFQNSSLKIIFERVGLTLKDCEAVLPQYGFTPRDWERKFEPVDRPPVEALLMDPEIQHRIEEQAKQLQNAALGYLEQEGLFEDVPYGLVDLGWTGVSKGALEGILSLRGKTPSPFFFFGRMSRDSRDDSSILHAYHFNMDRNIGTRRKLGGIPVLMEMFCASLSDGLRHYEFKNGGYQPVLRPTNIEAIREWGFDIMRRSILDFADKLATKAARMTAPFFLPPPVSDVLLRAFWLWPTRQEAKVWGQFPFEEDPGGSSINRLVPPVKPVNFWRVFGYGRGFLEYSEWRGGIIAANPPWIGFLWIVCLVGFRIRNIFTRLLRRS